MNKRLLLIGFYGEGNLGDDAILQGIMSVLPRRTKVTVTSGAKITTGEVKRIERRGLVSWPSYLRALKHTSLVVGSGGLLQDWSFEGITFYALRFLAAACLKKPAALFGAGIGPIRSLAGKRLAAAALHKIKDAYLRDDESVNLFHSLTGRRAERGTDWSWALQSDSKSVEACNSQNKIAINIRPWFDNAWSDALRRKLEISDEKSYVGIAAREEDARLMKFVVPRVHIYEPSSFAQLLEFSKRFKEGWAMRYHVILAFLRAGLPTVALPYDEKVRRLAKAAGIPLIKTKSNDNVKAKRPSINFAAQEELSLKIMTDAFKRLWECL